MGSNERADERPIHEVNVPAFELGRTEVTVGQYRVFVEATGHPAPLAEGQECVWGEGVDANRPVVCVNQADARAFAEWAGGRLPSEAEWEYAARSGGLDQTYPWGDEAATCERAVMEDGLDGCGENSSGPVCSRSP